MAPTTMKAPDNPKFTEPLYNLTEASLYLGLSPRTFWDWVHGQGRSEPLISNTAGARRGEPAVSFIGLSEAMVLRAFRKAGLTMQYIRKALRALQEDATAAGIDARYALASQRLYKHGARVLVDYSDDDETRRLFELVSKNMVFTPIVENHLQRITYGEDGWASRLILPATPTEPMSPSDQTEGKGKMTWVTVKLIVAVLVKPSEEPVTVTTTVPVAAVGLAVRVSELVVIVLLGMNEAVTPLGRPEADKLIVPLKPPCSATVTVLVPLEPCGTVSPVGAAEMVKLP